MAKIFYVHWKKYSQNDIACIRRDKLNSVYRHKDFDFACGRVVIFHISNEQRMLESYARTSKSPRSRPLISAIGGWGSKCRMFTVLDMKSEIFGENLKIHAGGDDKQQIQFAPL